jgi:SAM-dependent methyltransferase
LAENAADDVALEDVVVALYRGVLGREPDEEGLRSHLRALRGGEPLSRIVSGFISCDEFAAKRPRVRTQAEIELPDLTRLFSEKYIEKGVDFSIFLADDDADFGLLESVIHTYGYYTAMDVYFAAIDIDKKVTAAIIRGLGATSALEIGCFAGQVLSLLSEEGIEVCGVDRGHLAFVLACNNVRDKIRFGDLLDLDFDRRFDVIAAMDLLEHLNPAKLDLYIERVGALLERNGFVLVNSPMFGRDDIFGEAFHPYLAQWRQAGEGSYWRHIHCDAKGWPLHGHLVWAGATWWERLFQRHGLARDRDIERHLQSTLKGFFNVLAPARRSLFVLRREADAPDLERVKSSLDAALYPVVAAIPQPAPPDRHELTEPRQC